jgi:hypothetical protein
MVASDLSRDLSLLGGPLHRLGCRLGLVRNGTNSIALGVAIGLFLWVILVFLAIVGGVGGKIFSLSLIAGHVRLLLVIPLLFLCEALLDPRAAEFARFLFRWQLVPEQQVAALDAVIGRVNGWQQSWLPEVVCLALAAAMSFGAMHHDLGGNSSGFDPGHAASGIAAAAWWYAAICLTVFRFLVLRWAWRLCVWTYFLWRVSRFELRLIPTHPDGAGGLGYLEVVHSHFVPLLLAISALAAANFAEGLVSGAITFEAVYPQLATILAVDAALFLGPLLIFIPRLWACRVRGLRTYMGLAELYVSQFDSKWIGASTPAEQLLGTADIQSLADLSNSVNIVRNMRLVPASPRLLMGFAVAALLPMLPLLLLKYPIAELASKLFTGLVGL